MDGSKDVLRIEKTKPPLTRHLLSGIFLLSCLVVAALVTVALILTYVANKYDTLGLGWVGIGAWIVIAALAVVLTRRKVPFAIGAFLVPVWLVVALSAYTLIGYHVFGWTGLMK